MRPVLLTVAAVAAATAAVYALRPFAPVVSLGVVYVVPVLVVSAAFGLRYAIPAAIASQLVFNFLFLPPVHTLALRDPENWVALAVNLAIAVVVSQLAARLVAAERVRRSDEIKTAVLRSVSHDLRSPLTAIRAASEGLAAGTLDDAERRDLAEAVRSETQRLDRLVADLLDLSRLEAGAAEPHRELWPPDMLAAGALDAVGPEAARVAVVLPEHAPPVLVDSAQAGRVLANLLENALKFTPPPWAVELTVAHEDGDVVFRVSDHGPGVAAADRERVFEPFERGAGAEGTAGSGLGLAIARGFADANGWRLWIEPAERGGATFALALPAEDVR